LAGFGRAMQDKTAKVKNQVTNSSSPFHQISSNPLPNFQMIEMLKPKLVGNLLEAWLKDSALAVIPTVKNIMDHQFP